MTASRTGEPSGIAAFREVTASGVDAVERSAGALSQPGFYAVVITFEGELAAVRMRNVSWHPDRPWDGWVNRRTETPRAVGDTTPRASRAANEGSAWQSSLTESAYERAVDLVRQRIAAGDVYQANITRVLSRAVAEAGAGERETDALFDRILEQNPAPFASRILVPQAGLDIASASPELFLRRDGRRMTSAPIKGTATSPQTMLAKDAAENIMITDLVRNDLQTVCQAGTVAVESLLETQRHPGLVHLVSTIAGDLRADCEWRDILAGTFPPGSVSGAPKSSALRIIRECESVARGPYCGAIGWVYTPDPSDGPSGDRGPVANVAAAPAQPTAELAVGIRTFWRTTDIPSVTGEPLGSEFLLFGTGAGITFDSDPHGEWQETELKARNLLAIADLTSARLE